MLLAVGNVETYPLLNSMKLIANDQTQQHEWHKVYPQGTYIHHDGWGAVSYKDDQWQVDRSPLAFPLDPATRNLPITPSFLLLHLRRKSAGECALENTHPFQIIHNNTQFFFAHNGHISVPITFNQQFQTKGCTDSEKLLYAILSNSHFGTDPAQAISQVIEQYPAVHGSNMILSCPDWSLVALAPAAYQRYFTMHLGKNAQQTIICSEPLSSQADLEWQQLKPGSICFLDHKTQTFTITPLGAMPNILTNYITYMP